MPYYCIIKNALLYINKARRYVELNRLGLFFLFFVVRVFIRWEGQ